MKNDNIYYYIIPLVLGAVLLAAGIFVIDENAKAVSGLCIGIGSGLIGMNIAKLIIYRYYKKRPSLKKQSEIEARDERSLFITNKAKAKAFDIITKILIIVPFLFILTGSPLWMVLITVTIYVFGFSTQIYYTIKFNKEM